MTEKDVLEEGGEAPIIPTAEVLPMGMVPMPMMPIYIPPMVAPPVEFSYTYQEMTPEAYQML